MNHRPDIEELLCDYVDGTLDAEKRQQVEAILAQDLELRQTVQQMLLGKGALKALPIEKAPAHVAGQIRQAIDRPASPARSFSVAKLAAALLLTFSLAAVVWSILPREKRSPMAAAIPQDRYIAMKSLAEAEKADEAMAPAPLTAAAPTQADGPIFASANASALMYVRASDIPAVEREIAQLVTSNRLRNVVSNSGADWTLPAEAKREATVGRELRKSNDLMEKDTRGAGALADAVSAPAAAPEIRDNKEAAKPAQPFAGQRLEAQAAAPSGPAIAAATTPQIHLPDITADQLLQIQENVIALSPSNRVEIVSPDAYKQTPAAQSRVQSDARADMQQQMLRSMPSASPQDLQQFSQMRQQQQLNKQAQAASPQRYDLTIIIQPEQLPPAATPATLPATLPQR